MAAIPVILNGTFTQDNGQSYNGTFQGLMGYSDRVPGGGPIVPPDQPPSKPPTPIHPIWGPPGFNPPGEGMPPGIWGGPILPEPPDVPPDVPPDTPPGTVVKPPPSDEGGWGYVHPYGWAYFPGPNDAGPKRGKGKK